MNEGLAPRLAWSLLGLVLAMLVGSLVLTLLAGGGFPADEVISALFFPVFLGAFGSIGAMIASRHPRNAIGWIFLGTAVVWGLAILATGVATAAAGGLFDVSGPVRVADWIGSWIFLSGIYVPVTFLFLLFPDGRLPSRRWRPVAWISVAGIVGVTVGSALTPGPIEDTVILRSNPYGVGSPGMWEVAGSISWGLAFVGMLASVAGLFVRLRRASGEDRQRIKLLAYAGVVVAFLFFLAGLGWSLVDDPGVASVVFPLVTLLALFLIPVAAGAAILRHRLYDIDVVINKTVIYAVLAAFVTLVYVGVVIGVGALIGSRGNLFLSIVATALIAVAFQPIRERARRLANRLVYGNRATPYEVMSEFAERMAGTHSVDDVLPRMARIAAEGTGADRVDVWVRVGDELRLEASWPEAFGAPSLPLSGNELPSFPEADRAVPVTHQGDVLGAVAMVMPRREPLTLAAEKLIGDLAGQAGLVLRNVRLIEELRASRQRIVAAQDEERRRIERNLHDGAQQQLVALAVQLRLAEQIAAKKAPDMADLLGRIKAETQEALDNLRDLARGIYPPLLADQGLPTALEAQARKAPVPVEVESDGVGRYSAEAEAAAYFCILEALQNVAKYAEASTTVVRLTEDDGRLVFLVRDDGRGFDVRTQPRGLGLRNMADRVEALGGTLEIASSPGEGTTVTGRVPVRSVTRAQAGRAAAQASESLSGSNSDLGM